MTRVEFIRELDQRLSELPDKERLDLLSNYTQHFLAEMEKGKKEEEIAASLGSPAQIAEEILTGYHLSRMKANATIPKAPRMIIAGIGLGFFNVVVVLGPFLAIAGSIIGLWVAAFALILSPVALMAYLAPPVSGDEMAYAVFGGMAAVGFGLLVAIVLYYVTKWMYRLTVLYVRFNLRLIRGE
ncbi:DUF1700 domain-containing protein [Brevibacillus sp. SYP-B805]|uniref:HAAS signaling domain-containing protein n=1 Tax=Brevibacillus sp. SYP-B805 TaxID=1578199 RepID=UPI0013ED61EE|nr:DUF1700 domain-containing protein [Brevibacillus sp. SYP-B805]NGQ94339.1 DUF1700 domain-containing protein [Brevibacillus sp. SYP-B805]